MKPFAIDLTRAEASKILTWFVDDIEAALVCECCRSFVRCIDTFGISSQAALVFRYRRGAMDTMTYRRFHFAENK